MRAPSPFKGRRWRKCMAEVADDLRGAKSSAARVPRGPLHPREAAPRARERAAGKRRHDVGILGSPRHCLRRSFLRTSIRCRGRVHGRPVVVLIPRRSVGPILIPRGIPRGSGARRGTRARRGAARRRAGAARPAACAVLGSALGEKLLFQILLRLDATPIRTRDPLSRLLTSIARAARDGAIAVAACRRVAAAPAIALAGGAASVPQAAEHQDA